MRIGFAMLSARTRCVLASTAASPLIFVLPNYALIFRPAGILRVVGPASITAILLRSCIAGRPALSGLFHLLARPPSVPRPFLSFTTAEEEYAGDDRYA